GTRSLGSCGRGTGALRRLSLRARGPGRLLSLLGRRGRPGRGSGLRRAPARALRPPGALTSVIELPLTLDLIQPLTVPAPAIVQRAAAGIALLALGPLALLALALDRRAPLALLPLARDALGAQAVGQRLPGGGPVPRLLAVLAFLRSPLAERAEA